MLLIRVCATVHQSLSGTQLSESECSWRSNPHLGGGPQVREQLWKVAFTRFSISVSWYFLASLSFFLPFLQLSGSLVKGPGVERSEREISKGCLSTLWGLQLLQSRRKVLSLNCGILCPHCYLPTLCGSGGMGPEKRKKISQLSAYQQTHFCSLGL